LGKHGFMQHEVILYLANRMYHGTSDGTPKTNQGAVCYNSRSVVNR